MESLSEIFSGSSIDYFRCCFSGSYVNGSMGSFGDFVGGSLIDYTDG
jgi:hypothetical protein